MDVSIDAHHHPASKLASVADHLSTALRACFTEKRKQRKPSRIRSLIIDYPSFLILKPET